MLMDYELHVAVNAKIAELVNKAQEDGITLDMIVSQADKYENTPYETIAYGLGSSKGLNSEKYYFNAIEDEKSPYNKLTETYYNEPVSYYEHIGTVDKSSLKPNPIEYNITVNTFSRVITVYHVTYDSNNSPVYNEIEQVNLKPSKFTKKVIVKAGV